MDETKKLLIGIVAVIIVSGGISFALMPPKAPTLSEVMQSTMGTSEINTSGNSENYTNTYTPRSENQTARKVLETYTPIDIEKLKEKIGYKDGEIQQQKNSKDSETATVTKKESIFDADKQYIAEKYYLSDGTLKIEHFVPGKNKELDYTEMTKEVNGKYEGKSSATYPDGTVMIFEYKNGIKNGPVEVQYSNGDVEKFTYKNGKSNGKGVYYFSNGDIEEYIYKNGVMDGSAKYTYSNGKVEKYSYKNGKRK